MKVLFVATVRSHIGQFHMPFIRALKERGFTVDAAFKDNSVDKPGLDLSAIDNVFEIPFSRSPFSLSNIKAYFMLKKVINSNGYDAVHCHTPMGAVVARLASIKQRKKGMKVIYTAHGFHFYNGASKKNWLLFYPVEKYLSKHTDCLITINGEDYKTAVERKFKAGKIVKVNGVGVDLSKFKPVSNEEKNALRSRFGYSANDFLLIYPADFSVRKNQEMLFDALAACLKEHSDIYILLPGAKSNVEKYQALAESKNISSNVNFMGYRRDIEKLVAMADVSVSTSRQEGLPINLIEAMAVGNPVIATDVRGNNDLVEDGKTGFLVRLNDSEKMTKRILELYGDREKAFEMGRQGMRSASIYSEENVIKEMISVYGSLGLLAE